MLIVMKKGSTREDLARVTAAVESLELTPHVIAGAAETVVAVTGNTAPLDPARFEGLPGVSRAIAVSRPYRLAARDGREGETTIPLGNRTIGGGGVFVVAGPCAVENEEQLLGTARWVKAAGADALRGGAFKPRSSPYSFQGLGREGLEILARAREETGLPIVTEAVGEASLELVAEYADVVQIGARNMQNYEMLKKAGRLKRPIFLKRGMSATLEDLLLSAEYVLNAGNDKVILCERGIRTFSQHSRFTLDLSIVPALRDVSHLPIFVDPSHATGFRDRVPPMAAAAVAAGADGVMLEVHPSPEASLSDGRQSLLPAQLAELVVRLRDIASVASPRTETVR
jgi:3-deoxy-7-phosphoheptulonate synthase